MAESLLTGIAFVRLLSSVSPFMNFSLVGGSECLSAKSATEGLLTGMDHLVNFLVGDLGKRFRTKRQLCGLIPVC